jgi:hypothetical protein
MKIAIISDIHDNLANLEIFFEIISKENIEKIICCGDVCNQETLEKLAKKFNKPIIIVFGNADIYDLKELEKYSNVINLGRFGHLQLNTFKVGVCHEPGFIRNLFQEKPDLNFIFYGHTHKPWMSMKNKATLINPGTLGGVFQKPSFAIWDDETGKTKLKLLHDIK